MDPHLSDDILRICSFNLHGLSNSSVYLHDLCCNNDIIFIQEHWLLRSELSKMEDVLCDFKFFGCSAIYGCQM